MSRTLAGTAVKSSTIVRFRYTEGVLLVQFKNGDGSPGKVYKYEDVAEKTVAEFEAARSKGEYFHANIRRYHKATPIETGWPL